MLRPRTGVWWLRAGCRMMDVGLMTAPFLHGIFQEAPWLSIKLPSPGGSGSTRESADLSIMPWFWQIRADARAAVFASCLSQVWSPESPALLAFGSARAWLPDGPDLRRGGTHATGMVFERTSWIWGGEIGLDFCLRDFLLCHGRGAATTHCQSQLRLWGSAAAGHLDVAGDC